MKMLWHKISLFQNTHFWLFILYYILLKYQFLLLFLIVSLSWTHTITIYFFLFTLEKHKIIIIIKLFCISYSDLYICTSTIVCSKIWLFSTLSKTFASMVIALVGPNSLRPWPIYLLGPTTRAEKGYNPGSVIQVQNSLGTQPRTIQSSACPRSHKEEGQKRYRNSLGKNLKYLCR